MSTASEVPLFPWRRGSNGRGTRSSASSPRVLWFIAASLVFLISSWIAFRQEPYPDPYAYEDADIFSSVRFWYPLEFNATQRLPRVWVNFNDVFALKKTGEVWVVGGGGLILHSSDYGWSWTRQYLSKPGDTNLETQPNLDLRSVHFVDDQYGWVGGDDGALFTTQNGGRTWIRKDIGLAPLQMVYFDNRAHGYILRGINKCQLLYTSDGGKTWAIDEEMACFPEIGSTTMSRGPLEIVINTAGLTFVADESIDLHDLRSVLIFCRKSKCSDTSILPRGDGAWVIVGQNTILLVDNEISTQKPLLRSVPGIKLTAVSVSDSLHGYAVGTGGTLLGTDDGGASWRSTTRGLPKNRSTTTTKHALYFAPWYYLSLALVGRLLVPALRRPKPMVINELAKEHLVSDNPIASGEADVCNFSSVALGLSKFLRNEKTMPPLTISITGEWGSGKSSLMNLLRGDLKRFGFRPVWFNAWHHQKEEHLLASLLETVRAQAIPLWWRPEALAFRWRLLKIRSVRFWPWTALVLILFAASLGYLRSHPAQLHAVQESAKDPMKWLQVITSAGETQAWSFFLLSSLGLLISLWKGLKGFGVNPASLLAKETARAKVSDLENLTGFRHRFAAEFKDITKALNPRTLLVLIDDLDRCRPEMVLEVLEAVNFLISSGDCFVVLGMARERVVRCVGLSFKDVASDLLETAPSPEEKDLSGDELARRRRIEYANHYLEKLINIEVPVPTMTDEQSRRLLVESLPESELEPTLRWGDVWAVARKPLPVLAMAILLGLAFWLGSRQGGYEAPEIPKIPIENPSPTKAQTAAAPTAPAAVPAQAVLMTTTTSGPARMEEGVEARLSLLPLIVLSVVLIGLGVWRLSIPAGVVVRDSYEFERALRAWHPLLHAFRKTPRAIKRFLNRVRYLAMLQKGHLPEPALGQQFLAWLLRPFRKDRDEPQAAATPAIPEHILVALATIEHCRPQWFERPELLRDVNDLLAREGVPVDVTALEGVSLPDYLGAYQQLSRGIQVR